MSHERSAHTIEIKGGLLCDHEEIDKLNPKSPKYMEALKVIPDDPVPIFDELLEHYKFAAPKQHGKAIASPLVIGELVLIGWRNTEEPRDPKTGD